MFILTTLDTNYPEIWEKSGTATFSSHYEGDIIPSMQESLHNGTVYAIGMYRSCRAMPQEYAPSLLKINDVRHIRPAQPYGHDIAIDFLFIGKLPASSNKLLNSFRQGSRTLIMAVDDILFLRRLLQSLQASSP